MRTFEKLSDQQLCSVIEDVLSSTKRIALMSREELTTSPPKGVPPSEVAHLKLGILFQLRDECEARSMQLSEAEHDLFDFLTMVEDVQDEMA